MISAVLMVVNNDIAVLYVGHYAVQQTDPLSCWYVSTRLHGITFQQNVTFSTQQHTAHSMAPIDDYINNMVSS
jgi:hypothetical protein